MYQKKCIKTNKVITFVINKFEYKYYIACYIDSSTIPAYIPKLQVAKFGNHSTFNNITSFFFFFAQKRKPWGHVSIMDKAIQEGIIENKSAPLACQVNFLVKESWLASQFPVRQLEWGFHFGETCISSENILNRKKMVCELHGFP